MKLEVEAPEPSLIYRFLFESLNIAAPNRLELAASKVTTVAEEATEVTELVLAFVVEVAIAVWSLARTTGTEAAIVFWPTVGAVLPSQLPIFVSNLPPTRAAGSWTEDIG